MGLLRRLYGVQTRPQTDVQLAARHARPTLEGALLLLSANCRGRWDLVGVNPLNLAPSEETEEHSTGGKGEDEDQDH